MHSIFSWVKKLSNIYFLVYMSVLYIYNISLIIFAYVPDRNLIVFCKKTPQTLIILLLFIS